VRVLRVTAEEAEAMALVALGLNPHLYSLDAEEALGASLRRAASFLCPTSSGRLVGYVMEALAKANDAPAELREKVADQLDALVACGDLVELQPDGEGTPRQLFLGAPSFVRLSADEYLLLGIRPSGGALLPEEVSAGVEHRGHTRKLKMPEVEAYAALEKAGLRELRREHWLGHPPASKASQVVAAMAQTLDAAQPATDVPGLSLLDPKTSVRFYRGRWRPPTKTDSGDFVARRPQAYGADLWCLVRMLNGQPRSLNDLPSRQGAASARDEAWQLQAAIDAETHPQEFRLRFDADNADLCLVDLFGPVPSWAQHYLDAIGSPSPRTRGALFTYRVSTANVPELKSFLTSLLWMKTVEEKT
jgi:hypothetical protein